MVDDPLLFGMVPSCVIDCTLLVDSVPSFIVGRGKEKANVKRKVYWSYTVRPKTCELVFRKCNSRSPYAATHFAAQIPREFLATGSAKLWCILGPLVLQLNDIKNACDLLWKTAQCFMVSTSWGSGVGEKKTSPSAKRWGRVRANGVVFLVIPMLAFTIFKTLFQKCLYVALK